MNGKRFLSVMLTFAVYFYCSASSATDSFAKTTHLGEYPSYPKIVYSSGTKAEKIKRGEYLVKMGDCIACHTAPHGGKAFAGGLGIKTPFGTLYTPNITPNKETGIGGWSDNDFIKAMHEGISPKGHYYYPAFPFYYFNIIKTQDLLDIHAYLNAIPSVHQKNKKDTIIFPFNWRFLQIGWRLLFFTFHKKGPYRYNPKESQAWNRGYYLVNGLAHCGMCHTPSYYLIWKKFPLAAPIQKYALTGNMVQGFYAPNITSTLLKNVSLKELANVFLKDKLIGNGEVQGPMKDANHDSLKYLTKNDIKAIDIYLLSIKNKEPPKPSHTHQSGLAQGKTIYNQYCSSCHTTGAGGAPKIGDNVAWAPRLKEGLNSLYKDAINGIGGMPAKGMCLSCTNQEIQYAVNYIISKSTSSTSRTAGTGTSAQSTKKLTMADGKHIYETHCALCHDKGKQHLNAPVFGNKQQWKPIIKQGLDVVLMHTIKGYGNMPARGGCTTCNDAEIKAAVKYMVQNSQTGKDYSLW